MRRMMLWCVALVVVAGCKKQMEPWLCGGCIDSSYYRPLTTYAAPLYDLVLTYDNHNADAVTQYKSLFASDIYQFRYFDPQSSTPTTPLYWGYSEESTTATGLLTDTQVTRLELLFPLEDTINAVASTVPGDPPGTRKIVIAGINLQMQRGDILYQTSGSATFYIAPISGAYKIVRWEDNTAPPVAAPGARHTSSVRPTTWGSIKSLYSK